MVFAPVPSEIKPVAHLMKIADEHDARNIVVAYWARMAACRLALKMTPKKKSPETTALLGQILSWLETTKKENYDNDGIKSETTAQAILEEYALQVLAAAERRDELEIFDKNTVKTFYTAGILFDVLDQFGLSEDLHEKQKYAKWKAAYIHNCLKSGEHPQPGPPANGSEDDKMVHISDLPEEEQQRLLEEQRRLREEEMKRKSQDSDDLKKLNDFANITPGANIPSGGNQGFQFPNVNPSQPSYGLPTAGISEVPSPSPGASAQNLPTAKTVVGASGVPLTSEQIQKAQKYSKFATSALNYDDINTAVENLRKALNLLQFGKE